MSYEISLYQPEFLKRAIQDNLGDWTTADPLLHESILSAQSFFTERGYTRQYYPWSTDSVSYQHPELKELVEATIFNSSITFTIEYSDQAADSIRLAIEVATELGNLLGLSVYDPQDGRIIDDEA